MSTYKATGIILRRTDYGEADRIYTILTAEGKISAIAKSVRKMTAKLSRHLELLCEIDLMLARGKTLDVVTSAQIKSNFVVRDDYESLKRGFLFLEMTDRLSEDKDTAEIYYCLRDGLQSLKLQSKPAASELAFKLNLLKCLGQAPNLVATVDMQEPIEPGRDYGFDYAEGGLVAGTATDSTDKLSADAIKYWRICLRSGVGNAVRISNADSIASDSMATLNRFLDYLYGIEFKADQI